MTHATDRDIYFSFFMFTADLRPDDRNYTQTIIGHIRALRALGYSGFDLPIAPTDTQDRQQEVASYASLKQAFDGAGLADVQFTTNVAATSAFDPSSSDESQRAAALTYLKSRVDITKALGGKIMAGPIVLPYGVFPTTADHQGIWSDALQDWVISRYKTARPVLEELAQYAQTQQVKVAIEPVDHWETSAPNLVSDVMTFLEDIYSPQLGVCIDSAHVVLGSDGPDAFTQEVKSAVDKNRLHYVHISAPDRGAVRNSWIPWKPFLEPILAGYDGPLLVEVFNAIPVFLNGLRLTRRRFLLNGEEPLVPGRPDAYSVAGEAIEAVQQQINEVSLRGGGLPDGALNCNAGPTKNREAKGNTMIDTETLTRLGAAFLEDDGKEVSDKNVDSFRAASTHIATGDRLGPLADLPGFWQGTGFAVTARPNFSGGNKNGFFLELNYLQETIEIRSIGSPVFNRGSLQDDIAIYGLTYLWRVTDSLTGGALHIEPGMWLNIPATTEPKADASIARLATIPHGNSFCTVGFHEDVVFQGLPDIPPANTIPFKIGTPPPPAGTKNPYPEYDLSVSNPFRSNPLSEKIIQQWVDDPNAMLRSALQGQHLTKITRLITTTNGGVENIPFITKNAETLSLESVFAIETVQTAPDNEYLQLQYSQTALLNFNGMSFPHVTVGTLIKAF